MVLLGRLSATATPTAAPPTGSTPLRSGPYELVRTLISYTGTVNTAALRLWVHNRETGGWHRGASTDQLDPLTPGGASPINEVRDWKIGRGVEFSFQVEIVAGGGTVVVTVMGVDV